MNINSEIIYPNGGEFNGLDAKDLLKNSTV